MRTRTVAAPSPGRRERRGRGPLLAALTAAVVAIGGAVGIVAAPVASAHSNNIGGSATCQDDGTWTITWTISNDYKATSTITESNRSAVPTGSTIGGFSTASFQEPGITSTGSRALSIESRWSDGFERDNSGSVNVTGTCTPKTYTATTTLSGSATYCLKGKTGSAPWSVTGTGTSLVDQETADAAALADANAKVADAKKAALPPGSSAGACVPPAAQPDPPAPPAPVAVVVVKPATVYDGVLPCGGTVDVTGDLSAPGASVTRLSDADKADADCTPLPYSLFNESNEVEFLKPPDEPFAQFVVDVIWGADGSDPGRPDTYVDFAQVPGGYELLMPTCPNTLRDATGAVVGLPDGATLTPAGLAALGITDQDGLPRPGTTTDNGITQFACVASRTPIVAPPMSSWPQSLVKEQIYLLGDVFIRR